MACPSCCNKSTNSRSPCHSHPTARQKLDAVAPFHLPLFTFHLSSLSRVSRASFLRTAKIRTAAELTRVLDSNSEDRPDRNNADCRRGYWPGTGGCAVLIQTQSPGCQQRRPGR